jgi:ParB-like nuclease family protein
METIATIGVRELTNLAGITREKFEYRAAGNKVTPTQPQAHLSPVTMVPIGSLLIADSPRIAGENVEHVRALADTQAELPPIVVHRATMRVIDGLHRLRAADVRDQDKIAVRFFDGDEADAFVLAVRANVTHGLPLSLADRKAAAARIIGFRPQWSDRMIASVTGTSAGTVAEIRRNLAESTHEPDCRIGRDGRVRPTNIGERRRLAGNLIRDNPDLSLRQVAKAAGISPETVRAVRAGLRLGENPALPKARSPKRKTEQSRSGKPPDRQVFEIGRGQVPAGDRESVIQQLQADPALRFTDTGRALLRLLNVHQISNEKWSTIASNVPAHCTAALAQVAMECAQSWRMFAERLERNKPTPE